MDISGDIWIDDSSALIGRSSQESSPPTSSSYLWPRRPQAPWASRRSVTLPSPCTFGFDARPAKGCVVNDGGGDGWMDGGCHD